MPNGQHAKARGRAVDLAQFVAANIQLFDPRAELVQHVEGENAFVHKIELANVLPEGFAGLHVSDLAYQLLYSHGELLVDDRESEQALPLCDIVNVQVEGLVGLMHCEGWKRAEVKANAGVERDPEQILRPWRCS